MFLEQTQLSCLLFNAEVKIHALSYKYPLCQQE